MFFLAVYLLVYFVNASFWMSLVAQTKGPVRWDLGWQETQMQIKRMTFQKNVCPSLGECDE